MQRKFRTALFENDSKLVEPTKCPNYTFAGQWIDDYTSSYGLHERVIHYDQSFMIPQLFLMIPKHALEAILKPLAPEEGLHRWVGSDSVYNFQYEGELPKKYYEEFNFSKGFKGALQIGDSNYEERLLHPHRELH